jgi:LacI family transcriptional regulator
LISSDRTENDFGTHDSMPQRTTIKELARRSGVSIGTVSRALNGYVDVAPETRRRILALAEELDYTPQAAARTLVTQRSHVVGVFLLTEEGRPDLQHPFFHEVLVGLKDTLGEHGYDLLLFASAQPGNGFGQHPLLKRCRHHRVDGAVVMGCPPDDPEVRQLARSDLPCVAVDLELTGTSVAYVASDNVAGGRIAVEHLHALGHTRIATLAGPLENRPARDRLRGFRDGITQAGLAYRDEFVAYGDYYVDSGHDAARRLLALPERPTAIVAASDMMAVGAYRAARELGFEVPGDLSVIGYDDIILAAHLQPTLTTVRQDKEGLGAAAARVLLRQIDSDDTTPAASLPVELIVRGSTAPPRPVTGGLDR